MRYARRAHAHLGRRLRRLRVVLPGNLGPDVEDRLRGALSDQWDDVFHPDILAVGKLSAAG